MYTFDEWKKKNPNNANVQALAKAQANLDNALKLPGNEDYYKTQTYRNNINAINLARSAIDNRAKFVYDFNADALYQQYKDNYMRQGKMAMADTMAQAQALSGGFGNSYAASAGNLAYQGYLGQLNNVIPELQQLAYGRYQDEGNQLEAAYNRALQQNELGRQQYADQNAKWQSNVSLLTQVRDDARNMAMNDYSTYVSQHSGKKTTPTPNPDSTGSSGLSDSFLKWVDNYYQDAVWETDPSRAKKLLKQELYRIVQRKDKDSNGNLLLTKEQADEIMEDYYNYK